MAVLESPNEPLGEHGKNGCGRHEARTPPLRNSMNYSVAIPENLNEDLHNHLIRRDGQEDLCFALWNPSHGIVERLL